MTVQLEKRNVTNKVLLNKKRAEKLVPGVIYGPKFENKYFFINENTLLSEMKKGNFYHRIIECELDGKKLQVMAKEITSHPVKDTITHIDLKHISKECLVEVKVMVVVRGEEHCFDLQNGAFIAHKKHFITVQGQVSKIPEFVEIDVTHMKTGHVVNAKDIKLHADIVLLSNPNDVLFDITGKVRVL